MTSRERLLKVLHGEIPDCVPVAPDTSNMIPARLTGKPFWDLYLYQDPPIWKAYIDCVKHFGFDSLMDGYAPIQFEELGEIDPSWTEMIISRDNNRIITQRCRRDGSRMHWHNRVNVYYRDNPPFHNVVPASLELPDVPERYEPVEGVRSWPRGEALLKLVRGEMGDYGLVGVFCGTTIVVGSEQALYDYQENPDVYHARRDRLIEYFTKRLHHLMSLSVKPDFICTGGSGTLIWQTPPMFRELGLPIVREITALCRRYGIPSQIHSCGPERELVKMAAEETDLTVIDPLEVPPMGDCDLKNIKKLYGNKLVLKGNLHTTRIMLEGTPEDVAAASRQAIDDAAAGGRFILSTGDQCGRDTPDANIRAMIDTARTYGRYSR